jgi:small-conductance mechanosensitive channel
MVVARASPVVARVATKGSEAYDHNMPKATRIAEITQAITLGIWIGVMVMSAVVAAQVFPLMRELDPTLGAYPLFAGDHAPLAGGRVAAQVFLVADVVGFVCLILSGIATVVWIASERTARPVATAIRATLLLAIVVVFGYHLIVHGSALNEETRAYWAAADAGQTEIAEQHRAVIRDMHPMSRNLLSGTVILALASLVTGLWCLASPRDPTDINDTEEGGPSAIADLEQRTSPKKPAKTEKDATATPPSDTEATP